MKTQKTAKPTKTKPRCHWVNSDPLYVRYHDEEWGVPVHDDRKLFEFVILEGAQAGVSWYTVLQKRENYRKHFKNFEPARVAQMKPSEIAKILKDPGVIRNRLKLESVVPNAKAFLEVQKEFGSFDKYIWGFVGGKPMKPSGPLTTSPESDAMSKDLKKRGFKFVGSTTCYAFMQACGLISDHQAGCFLAPKRKP